MDPKWLDGLRLFYEATFYEFYSHYRTRLFNFLYRLAGHRDLAEDLFQETWMKLAKNAVTLDADTDLGGWLFTVARNAYFSHRRWLLMDAGRRREVELIPRDSDTPEHATERRRELEALERALAGLPVKDREVLLLVGVEGMEPEQAAAVLGIKWDALRQRLSRARALLAERLAEPTQRRAVR